MLKSRLSVKISLRLSVLAAALMALATWVVVFDARGAASEMLLDQGRVAALAGAQAYSSILESGIDSGVLKLADLIEPTYEEITFPGIRVEDKRYHTHYDGYTDSHGIQAIQDAILASSPWFIYASGMAVGGYVPTPHDKYNKPPNGDPKHDRAMSRAKRKYDEPLQLAAAGYRGKEPTLVQDYHRDTGELVWDVAAPIVVKGKHFGAFRVGVVKDRVHAQTVAMAWALGGTLGVAVLLLVAIVLILIQRAMRPLVELACTATRLSTSEDGMEFEKKIRVESTDEVGQMARALELMRRSLRGAWSRLRLLDDALVALGLRPPGGGDSADAARQRCAEAEAGTYRREESGRRSAVPR
jgi:HAMP domain-containing protein